MINKRDVIHDLITKINGNSDDGIRNQVDKFVQKIVEGCLHSGIDGVVLEGMDRFILSQMEETVKG